MQTTIVSGPIGIIDAALVRFLEKSKAHGHSLVVSVTASMYEPLIPIAHIHEFLSALTMVDGVIQNQSPMPDIQQHGDTTLIHLPQPELQHYSISRILKTAGTLQGENKPKYPKQIPIETLSTRYGATPLERKEKVALVSGSFDLIHLGHVRYIQAAKEWANIVIVATMSTGSIQQQEKNSGGDRPIYSQEDRLNVLNSLRAVDGIVLFDHLDCKMVIEALRPDYFVKNETDLSRPVVQEECALVEKRGGRVIRCQQEAGYSSTRIIQLLRQIEKGEF